MLFFSSCAIVAFMFLLCMITRFIQLIRHTVQRMQFMAVSGVTQKGQRMLPLKIIPK